jgi:hypothetical protein
LPYALYGIRSDKKTHGLQKLTAIYEDGEKIRVTGFYSWMLLKNYRPLLYPLSHLTKEIEVNGEKLILADKIFPKKEYNSDFDRQVDINSLKLQNSINHSCSYFSVVQGLFKYHFDVFRLIEKGLAIDKTTL